MNEFKKITFIIVIHFESINIFYSKLNSAIIFMKIKSRLDNFDADFYTESKKHTTNLNVV